MMSRRLIAATLCGFLSAVAGCARFGSGAPPNEPLTAVESLNLARYMGQWQEIARYPNWFQKKCVANSRAEYRPLPDGTVEVVNSCRLADGSVSQAIGAARLVGGAGSPKLEVRFAPAPGVAQSRDLVDVHTEFDHSRPSLDVRMLPYFARPGRLCMPASALGSGAERRS